MKMSLKLLVILLGVFFATITQAQPIIIDHTCTDISKIPQQLTTRVQTLAKYRNNGLKLQKVILISVMDTHPTVVSL
jgi:hypothetical protein